MHTDERRGIRPAPGLIQKERMNQLAGVLPPGVVPFDPKLVALRLVENAKLGEPRPRVVQSAFDQQPERAADAVDRGWIEKIGAVFDPPCKTVRRLGNPEDQVDL